MNNNTDENPPLITSENPPSLTTPAQIYSKRILFVLSIVFLMVVSFVTGTMYPERDRQAPSESTNNDTQTLEDAQLPTNTTLPAATETSPNSLQTPPSSWVTYTDPTSTFSVKLPPEYEITYPYGNDFVVINHFITANIVPQIECGNVKGDCSYISDTYENVTINNYKVTKTKGYIAVIGGNIPTSYISYYYNIPNTTQYIQLSLYEIPQDDMSENFIERYPMDREIQAIPQESIDVFDLIASTLKIQ